MSKEVSNFPWEYLRELTGIDDVGLDNRLAAASDDDWRNMIQTISHRIAPLAGFANVVELNNCQESIRNCGTPKQVSSAARGAAQRPCGSCSWQFHFPSRDDRSG